MTHDEVLEMLTGLDIPFAYDHFAEGESPDPPFICFLYPRNESFGADNITFYSSSILNIELYTDKKNPELEEKLETILTENELYFEKTEVWIQSEKLYEVLYTVTV